MAWMVHVTSLWRLHRAEAEDERVDAIDCSGPFYPNFAIFYVLCPMCICFLVFCLSL
jgi:hypothetical protein